MFVFLMICFISPVYGFIVDEISLDEETLAAISTCDDHADRMSRSSWWTRSCKSRHAGHQRVCACLCYHPIHGKKQKSIYLAVVVVFVCFVTHNCTFPYHIINAALLGKITLQGMYLSSYTLEILYIILQRDAKTSFIVTVYCKCIQ